MQVIKRNGSLSNFEKDKIMYAIQSAMKETILGVDIELSINIAEDIEDDVRELDMIPTVESIQDMIEEYLMDSRKDVAKTYILYRSEREKNRANTVKNKYKYLSDDFLYKYKHLKDPFPTEVGRFVYLRTYSRPIIEEKRRELWRETVARAVDFNIGLAKWKSHDEAVREAEQIYDNIYNLKQFPSGRSLWSGGIETSYTNPISQYNCAFATWDNFDIIKDMTYLLMLGVGFGFSVEKQYVSTLPQIRGNIDIIHKSYKPVTKSFRKESTEFNINDDVMEIIVGDSKLAWANALDYLIKVFYSLDFAHVTYILINYDNVRPFGEPLRTFGGRASGHEALQTMIEKITIVLNRNNTQKKSLKPIDCLDISTIIAEGIVVGGTRRSAESCLSTDGDEEVMNSKMELYKQDEYGNWISNPELLHRQMANNSTAYWKKPSYEQLKQRFEIIKYSAENNFFNMESAIKRKPNAKGTNPCGEILLDSESFCNLVTLNVMAYVNKDYKLDVNELLEAQRLNARISYRITLPTLELPRWDKIQKRDRLLGLSLTGWQDMVNATNMNEEDQRKLLRRLKEVAIESANKYADELQLNRSELITCVKPEGTLSLLPTVSSGVHVSHSPYYIRRIRINSSDPLLKAYEELGYPIYPEVGQEINPKTKVIEFPVKAPEGKNKYNTSAIEQLETYRMFMEEYVQHNSSNTISVLPEEWDDVVEWVWNNWDDIIGITFISLDSTYYQLMPYESITEEEYNERAKALKPLNLSILKKYETFEEYDVIDDSCSTGVCKVR